MKNYIPASVTRFVARKTLLAQKHSPTILFTAGVVGVGATVVTACRSTLRLEQVLDETKDKLDKMEQAKAHPEYGSKEIKHDLLVIYIQAARDVTKLYGPSLILGVVSIAALTKSHRILNSRNAALTAAYAAVDKSFREYRERVVQEYGEERDREFRYGSETREVVVEDRNGPKKKKVKSPSLAAGYSMYAKFFDESNVNWNPQPEYNVAFLRLSQNSMTDQLRSRGHLFLNEVYDQLGLDRTPAGSQVGWIFGEGNGYVDFGIWDDKSMQRFHDFVTGHEEAILLDFNVDGVIWDKI